MIRHYNSLLLVVLAMISAIMSNSANAEFPASLDGSMMPYDFASEEKFVVPDSLEVIHVAYVARHGARYLSSEKKISGMRETLLKQSAANSISLKGKEFLYLLNSVDSLSKSCWGDLSEVGIQEEVRLGEEMSRLFPTLMKVGEVKAKSSYVPRVVMTMYQFLHSLGKNDLNLNITTLEGPANDSLLRCFDVYRDYSEYRESGMWKEVYEKFVDTEVSSAPAENVFGTAAKDEGKERRLTMEMYGVLQGLPAMCMDPVADEYMTEDEYRRCWEASNLQRYLRNTLNPLSTDCAGATALLLEDIIGDCDRCMPQGDVISPLTAWFGHAETLMPLLSVMNLPGCFYFSDDWKNVSKHWKSQDIVPLGANFMVIIMKPKSHRGPIYASLRLNGRNVSLTPEGSLLLPWSELRSRWLSRLRQYSPLDIPN